MENTESARAGLAAALSRLEAAADTVETRLNDASSSTATNAAEHQQLEKQLSEVCAEAVRLRAENERLAAEVKRLDHSVLDARMKAMASKSEPSDADKREREAIRVELDQAIALVDRILAEDSVGQSSAG